MSFLSLLAKARYRNGSILALDYYNWLEFDFAQVRTELKKFGIGYHSFNLREARTAPELKDIDHDFVYQAIIYTVCNELELMPSEVDLSNPGHAGIYKKWEKTARCCAGYAANKIATCNITKILVPQGYVLEAAVCRLLAARMNLPILAIENTLSNDRMLWENISGITVNENLSKNYYWKHKPLVSEHAAAEYSHHYLANIKSKKTSEHTTPEECSVKTVAGKKVILFLGQVYIDSSVMFGINRFANQESVIDQLCDYCSKHGHTLIVKLHPKEMAGHSIVNVPLNKMTWRKICALQNFTANYQNNPDVIIDHDNLYDTYKLIDLANVCVTINSMSGLEACISGKEVILCGSSCYGGLGFTSEAYDNQDLIYHLNKIMLNTDRNIDKRGNAMAFFYTYMKMYCVQKSETELVKLIAS